MSDADWSYPIGRRWQRKQLGALSAAKRRLPSTWITAENEIIEIAKMKNSHLRNTIEMLRRTALRKLSRLLSLADGKVSPLMVDTVADLLQDPDECARAAWGDVYDELISEALFRSDGDLEEWMQR